MGDVLGKIHRIAASRRAHNGVSMALFGEKDLALTVFTQGASIPGARGKHAYARPSVSTGAIIPNTENSRLGEGMNGRVEGRENVTLQQTYARLNSGRVCAPLVMRGALGSDRWER